MAHASSASFKAPPLAPGAIIEVRTEAWRVSRVERASDGSTAMHVVGVTELVRGKDAIFIKELEERIGTVKVLAPELTDLVADDSPNHRGAMLYMESLLRQIPPTDDKLHIGQHAAMDALSYQLDPALMALEQPRQRILIADSVGLGKTLEAGILLSELIQRGRGKRILVVAVKSMLAQFQKEMWSRFSIPLVRLDSVGLQRIRQRIPTNQNPFYYYDKTIISMDTLKQNNEYRVHLENAKWDIIVIDEAHNVAARGKQKAQRAHLAEKLSHLSDSLIMLSATPHDGKPESFASLMNMLDPTAIANPSEYLPEDIQGLFIRRFKKDIAHQVKANFPEREIRKAHASASGAEEVAFDVLANLKFQELDQKRGAYMLFRTVLEKALLSSPAACLKTVNERLRRMEADDPERFVFDAAALGALKRAVENISPEDFAKYQRLLEVLRDHKEFSWTGKKKSDRLVIFTERIETLKFLQERLIKDLGLKKGMVEILHGSMSDVDQQKVVESFGQENAKVRLLIASDVASEGINLHYQCHRLIHFDIPWSLMVFRQRNGRIDRYGQVNIPLILYLFTEAQNSKMRGDLRVLDILVEKDDQATKNIGDPSALMGVHDVDKEELITAEYMDGTKSADEFEKKLDSRLDPKSPSPFDIFLGAGAKVPLSAPKQIRTAETISLFESNYAYVDAALQQMGDVEYVPKPADHLLRIHMPPDLKARFALLPREIYPKDGKFVVSEDAKLITAEIERSRSDEIAWPQVHYLWPLNPMVSWVNDRMTNLFGRHAAPIINVSAPTGEVVFVVSGLVPNQKSQPVIHHWFGVVFRHGKFAEIEDFESTRKRLNLGVVKLINAEAPDTNHGLEKLLPEAVEQARQRMSTLHDKFHDINNPKLDKTLDRLITLEDRQKAHIAEKYANKSSARDAMRKANELSSVKRVFEEYADWVNDTLATEDHPFIQVIAVLRSA